MALMAEVSSPPPQLEVAAGEAAAGPWPRRPTAAAAAAAAAPARQPSSESPERHASDEGAGAGASPPAPTLLLRPGTAGGGGGGAKMDEVRAANEVLRLRSLKAQHDEYRAQLAQAEARLRRLSAFDILQLHSYLERHLADPGSSVQVQEAIVRLIEGLCLVCGIALDGPDGLLGAVRQVLREPHSFTGRLCVVPRMSSDEARGLAPFLLSTTQYRRVREKEVNGCYEALQAWLQAYYFVCSASDEVSQINQELERQWQECLVRRVSGGKSAKSQSPATSPSLAMAKSSSPSRGRFTGCASEASLHAPAKPGGGAGAAGAAAAHGGRPERRTSSPKPTLGGAGAGGGSLASAAMAATRPAGTRSPTASATAAAKIPFPRPTSPSAAPSGPGQKAPKALAPIRMQSDKTLARRLRDRKEAGRSPSPESPPSCSSTSSLQAPKQLPSLRGTARPPLGEGLASVPERRSSVPSKTGTLLDSIHRRSSVPNLKEDPVRRRVSTPFPPDPRLTGFRERAAGPFAG